MTVTNNKNYEDKFFFIDNLLFWGDINFRIFPWRVKNITVYESLIAELLLRKTTALQVEKVYSSFLEAFPSSEKLLYSPVQDIEKIIKPLGLYQQRVKVLKDISKVLVEKGIPKSIDEIKALPHVGIYIPNAVSCFCLGKRVPVIDANVVRIYSRFLGLNGPRDVRRNKEVKKIAWEMLPCKNYIKYNYALLDFGALVCKGRGRPKCKECPVESSCNFRKEFT
ncbi:MAG: hypothetical protein K9L17_10650 [Clostridiales bacterium]|nr:hypothetical protein [Clostridiales bacterium]MCF8023139.1 hypothetical protein [Clostridiales bacterium]